MQKLLSDGIALVSGDLYQSGESADCAQVDFVNDSVNRYFSTFHNTADANRVQDAVRLIRYAASLGADVTVRAEGIAARAAACAIALYDGAVSALLENDALTLPCDDMAFYREFFIPGIRLLGGPRGCLALAMCPVTLF